MKFERKTLPQKTYIYIEHTIAISGPEITQAMGTGFGELFMLLQKTGVAPISAPMAIYPDMPSNNQMTFRTAFAVEDGDAQKFAGQVETDIIPAGDAVMGLHVGPYMGLGQTHQALWKYMEGEGISGSFVWEVYIDDPDAVAEAELRTEVYRGVAS